MLKYYAILLFGLSHNAYSTENKLTTNSSTAPTTLLTPQLLLDTVLSLGLVVALIVGLVWLTKKWSRLNHFTHNPIQILGGVTLGHKEKAILIEVEGQKLVIGVTPQTVTLLHTLSNPTPYPPLEDNKG